MIPRNAICPRCGVPYANAGLDVCAACLLKLAAADSPSDALTATATGSVTSARGLTTQLNLGEVFGPYRIDRLLGSGGMGEVYEAEHLAHERRVALKVLNRRLSDPADRARFLREGELAASVNHPNSVYIFGSEEIAGVPIIAMELLPGGTLKDRVEAQGALAPSAAVDVILQVIAGLDAAFQSGVLHRDVKPSNCFLDIDGTVKIGDFGLSISTLRRSEDAITETRGIQATPQFAAPEQLTGRPLDVRADIYAVGAALYYLLTGTAPFTGDTLGALLARVLTEPAPSLEPTRADVPVGLERILTRCLAKDPAARPESYAALDQALRPYSSAAVVPAPLPVRFAAGAIDHATLMLAGALTYSLGQAPFRLQITRLLLALVYYSLLEGLWGASIGKRICGLRVARTTGVEAPGLNRRRGSRPVVCRCPARSASRGSGGALCRPGMVTAVAGAADSPLLRIGRSTLRTARRSNHLAAVHDLLTSTRVVMDPARRGGSTMSRPARHKRQRFLSGLAFKKLSSRAIRELPTGTGRLFVGYDDRLKRQGLHPYARTGSAAGSGAAASTAAGRTFAVAGRRADCRCELGRV